MFPLSLARACQDVQYGDIDYMDEQRDFTYDHSTYAGLPEFVREMQASGKHYVVILVCYVIRWAANGIC